jgi:hypothetical protein
MSTELIDRVNVFRSHIARFELQSAIDLALEICQELDIDLHQQTSKQQIDLGTHTLKEIDTHLQRWIIFPSVPHMSINRRSTWVCMTQQILHLPQGRPISQG